MTDKEIIAIRAAIALDNFWYYMTTMPAFADALMMVTDQGTFLLKNPQRDNKPIGLSPRGVSPTLSPTPKEDFRAV